MKLVLRHNRSGSGRGSRDGQNDLARVQLTPPNLEPEPKPEADLGFTIDDGGESSTRVLSRVDRAAQTSCADSMCHPLDGTTLRTDIGTAAYNPWIKTNDDSESHYLRSV